MVDFGIYTVGFWTGEFDPHDLFNIWYEVSGVKDGDSYHEGFHNLSDGDKVKLFGEGWNESIGSDEFRFCVPPAFRVNEDILLSWMEEDAYFVSELYSDMDHFANGIGIGIRALDRGRDLSPMEYEIEMSSVLDVLDGTWEDIAGILKRVHSSDLESRIAGKTRLPGPSGFISQSHGFMFYGGIIAFDATLYSDGGGWEGSHEDYFTFEPVGVLSEPSFVNGQVVFDIVGGADGDKRTSQADKSILSLRTASGQAPRG